MPAGVLQTPFQTLLRAIVHQQLSTRAAHAIHTRVLKLVSGRATPLKFARLDDRTLRDAGLSRAKVAALRDLCERTQNGLVPNNAKLKFMDDESIIDALSAVRGIGRWSVEMMLFANLRRPDILPATDLGIRKGFAVYRGRDTLPTVPELLNEGERWRPFRSVASWYLWRAGEL